MKANLTNTVSRQTGFSIVELMVAVLISLIVLVGVIQVVVTSKVTFLHQEEMSYIQENARYAMDVIGRDIQNAGHWGCAGATAEVAQVARVVPDAAALIGMQPIHGFAGEARESFPAVYRDNLRMPDFTATRFPDSFVVRRAEGQAYAVTDHQDAFLRVVPAHDYNHGDYLAVIGEDCRRMGIIRRGADNDPNVIDYASQICGEGIKPALLNPVTCDAECTCNGVVSAAHKYQPGSTVMRYSARAYYIGTSSALSGQPALRRAVLKVDDSVESRGAVSEEIALGVEAMEVLYGLDLTGDGQPNQYLPADLVAADQWGAVYAVQVALLFRSQTPSQQVNPADAEYGDRYLRQRVTSTFRLRNRI